MVKTAYFGHFRAKNIIHYDFFMFQDLTFTFLIIKNNNLSAKWSKLPFLAISEQKILFFMFFLMFQDLTFTLHD